MTDWGIDLSQSWLIGDRRQDVEAAHAAGVKSVMVQTGYGRYEIDPDLCPSFATLSEAWDFIQSRSSNPTDGGDLNAYQHDE